MNFEPYPKSAPRACRRDAWPDDGGAPGSNLDLIRAQYLDAYGIEFGILGPLGITGQSEINLDLRRRPDVRHQRLAARFLRQARAAPEGRDRRALRGRAAAAEIERCADDRPTRRCSC